MNISLFKSKNIQNFEKYCYDLTIYEKNIDNKYKELFGNNKISENNAEAQNFYIYLKDTWNEIYKSIVNYISENISQDKISNKSYSEYQYAMISLTDEVFLRKNNEISDFWQDNTLEYNFYGTRSSGTIIFEKIEKIINENDVFHSELAYVYLIVLGLGFKGKYQIIKAEDKTKYYQKELYRIFNNSDKYIEKSELCFSNSLNIPKNIKEIFLPDIKKWYFYIFITIVVYLVISSTLWIFLTSKLTDKIGKYNMILNEMIK